jgi:hypothetical protein
MVALGRIDVVGKMVALGRTDVVGKMVASSEISYKTQ